MRFLALSLLLSSCLHWGDGLERVELARWVMGSRLRIVILHEDEDQAEQAANRAFEVAEDLDNLLSNYKEDSDLSELNKAAAASAEWIAVPVDLANFVRMAIRLAAKTEGLFDPTVGAAMEARKRNEAPASAVESIGFRHVETDGNQVRFRQPGMSLDSGGIGKGVAVDAMVEELKRSGIERAFIDFGESCFYGLGAPLDKLGWKVELRSARGGAAGAVVLLSNTSLSTSMTKRTVDDGEGGPRERSHLVDPRTGKFVKRARIAAVVSPSAADSDAISTAIAVGGRKVLEVVGRFSDTSAYFQERRKKPVMAGKFPLSTNERSTKK